MDDVEYYNSTTFYAKLRKHRGVHNNVEFITQLDKLICQVTET